MTWCTVVCCTQNAPRWQQFHVAPAIQHPNSAVSSLHHFRGYRAQEVCESRGGRPGLPVPNKPTVSVDVKQNRASYTHTQKKSEPQRAIRGAKINYRKKPDDRLLTGDARAVWQGLLCQFPVTRGRVLPPQTTTPKSAAAPDDDPQECCRLRRRPPRVLPPQTTTPRVLPPQTTTPKLDEECCLPRRRPKSAAAPDDDPKSAAAPDDDPQARQRVLPPQTTTPKLDKECCRPRRRPPS